MIRPPTVAIDLDGTIIEQAVWTDGGKGDFVLIPGAVQEIKKLKESGWKIVIHTARFPDDLDEAGRRLRDLGVQFDLIWGGEGKPLADVYLDDKGITFEGKWEGMAERIINFVPYNGIKFLRPPIGSKDEQRIRSR